MTRNGTVVAHGREWPLYERQAYPLLLLEMSPEDEAEKNALDERAMRRVEYAIQTT